MKSQSPSDNRARALITGISGQDGYYLARLLASRGISVFGGLASHDAERREELQRDLPEVSLLRLDLLETESIEAAMREARPDRIFHLAALSHVAESWREPEAAVMVNTVGTLRMLESMRRFAPDAHLVFAGSADCFDHAAAPATGVTPNTPTRCTNPYAVSKLAAMQFVERYRNEFGLRASVAVMFNHTSPRRPRWFIERRITSEAVEIARGDRDRMILGSMQTRRDWSWAEDIVEGLARMAGRDEPRDFVLASGETHSTGDWARETFRLLGLDLEEHLELDASLVHSGDRPHAAGDISPARELLNWSPRVGFEEMVARLLRAEGVKI